MKTRPDHHAFCLVLGLNSHHTLLQAPSDFTMKGMKVDIKGSSLELAQMIKQDPNLVEKELLKKGDELVGFFEDSNFSNGFQNYRELKVELWKMVLEDLAMGAITLKTSNIGLTFQNGKVKTFITPFGVPPSGNLMMSVSLKNVVAFQKWRSGNQGDIDQEHLNAAIYRVIVSLAKVL
ncbi:MAG: hypothetical protein ACXWC9_03855 [Pseudobdellovibrionaceae bacterium]